MLDRFFPMIKLKIPLEQFDELPQNPAYKYEYFDQTAWLSPRPKTYDAFLRLTPTDVPEIVDAEGTVVFRPLAEADWEKLPQLFARAFHRVQPLSSLDDTKKLEAAQACIDHTRRGGDGPVIDEACFVAVRREDNEVCGAILITLLPDRDPEDWGGHKWKGPPPVDWRERALGRPHLTWIFVGPWEARWGVGGALLDRVAGPLLGLGYKELDSTFLLGNESSTLWHWKNGFVLRPFLGSPSRWRKRSGAGGPNPPG